MIEGVTSQERRSKPRIACGFQALVQGRDPTGKKFEAFAKLSNLSASGLYMVIGQELDVGEKLFVTINLSEPKGEEKIPRLDTRGTVIRKEQYREGIFGIAMQFQSVRFS